MDTKAKHTPGPWKKGPRSLVIYADSGKQVAGAYRRFLPLSEDEAEASANAALIAAAPELADALEAIRNAEMRSAEELQRAGLEEIPRLTWMDQLEAALRKAGRLEPRG